MTVPPVVFGVDFSPIMRRAIPWVREFIAPNEPVLLVHAIDAPPLPGFLRRIVPPAIGAEHICPPILARLQTLAERAGAPSAECVVRPGRADQVLEDVAEEFASPLIIIGVHGMPTRPWKRLGTTAERLLRNAHPSVMVVGGAMTGAPKRILVAVDDVEITPRVLATAGSIADAHDAELHGVHVLSLASYNHLLSAEAAEAGDETETRRRVEEDMADETLRWLREMWTNSHRHSQLQAHVPHGEPADEILRIAADQSADLIVMGRYGIGRVIPAVLGSVVGSVVAGANCPVLVISD